MDEIRDVQVGPARIRYREAGSGSPVVFVHGLAVDGRLWRKVTPKVGERFRSITPDWPLGAHEVPLPPDADLTPSGLARLIAGFLEALGLEDVTLVGNDTGGALCQLVVTRHPERIGRLVLTNCDCFENFLPPRFRYLQWGAHVPGFAFLMTQSLRLSWMRRSPLAFGSLTKRAIPEEILAAWARPAASCAEVRRDLGKVLRGISPRYTREAARRLHEFSRPVLIAWAPEDPFFRREHAAELARLFPNARLEWIEDSRTFVPEDQPERLAAMIAAFIDGSREAKRSSGS